MFLNVVTAAPGCSCGTIRETVSSWVAECRTMNAAPCSDMIAPRAKSGWPPDDEKYWLPSDSEAHCPRKSTSSAAFTARNSGSRAMFHGSLV